jgi:integrase
MSVRKRSWNSPDGNPKESWVVDYVDQTGKRHLKTFGRKKEADAYHDKAKAAVRSGIHTADESTTVSDAAQLWLTYCRGEELERATLAAYEQHIKLHIVPYVGRVPLARLSSPMVRQFRDRLRTGCLPTGESGAEETKRSAAMVKRVMGSLSSILTDAQERGLVAQNVVRNLRTRRRRRKERLAERRAKRKLKVAIDIPSPEEIRAIIAKLEGRWRPLLLTAIFTGLRSSELRGLPWRDVDLQRGEIHVTQRADAYGQLAQPKSEAGSRMIPVPPKALQALREWKLAQSPKHELVFAAEGKMANHWDIINNGLAPAQIAAGLTDKSGKAPKYRGLHSLRHFFASWCINRKVDGGQELPPKIVQERMGHATIMQTLDTYAHLFPRGDDTQALADAEGALWG